MNFPALIENVQARQVSSLEATSQSLCCSLEETAEEHQADDTLLSDFGKHWTYTESISPSPVER